MEVPVKRMPRFEWVACGGKPVATAVEGVPKCKIEGLPFKYEYEFSSARNTTECLHKHSVSSHGWLDTQSFNGQDGQVKHIRSAIQACWCPEGIEEQVKNA